MGLSKSNVVLEAIGVVSRSGMEVSDEVSDFQLGVGWPVCDCSFLYPTTSRTLLVRTAARAHIAKTTTARSSTVLQMQNSASATSTERPREMDAC